MSKERRCELEVVSICRVIGIFFYEKLQSVSGLINKSEDAIKKEIKNIIIDIFNKDVYKNAE
jgi:hypothetical protein